MKNKKNKNKQILTWCWFADYNTNKYEKGKTK